MLIREKGKTEIGAALPFILVFVAKTAEAVKTKIRDLSSIEEGQ
jgi:hypothetical protein